MRTADIFTWVRIVFAPIFYFLYMIPEWTGNYLFVSVAVLWPLLLFVEFTDFLDGYFARKKNEVSDFGKFFDPFADVLFHVTAFFCYAYSGYMPMWILMLIVMREIAIQFVRLLALKEGVALGAAMGGKIKTVLYILAGMFSFFIETVVRLDINTLAIDTLSSINVVLYVVCLIASYASFAQYVVVFCKVKCKS